MWILILFAAFALVVCITAFIRGASAVNGGERHIFLSGEPDERSVHDRDAA